MPINFKRGSNYSSKSSIHKATLTLGSSPLPFSLWLLSFFCCCCCWWWCCCSFDRYKLRKESYPPIFYFYGEGVTILTPVVAIGYFCCCCCCYWLSLVLLLLLVIFIGYYCCCCCLYLLLWLLLVIFVVFVVCHASLSVD